ncbi:MAG: hypothetical protein K0R51_2384 [Cytophagaceae bacterium]|jgi:hypothetical protein|nr:hypothetical protein [Cytophagaceae bacterium]
MENQTMQKIKEWLELRTYTLQDFIAAKKTTPDQIQEGSKKYKLENLIQIDEPATLSAHVYFYSSGKFALMNIYGKGLAQLSAADILSFYGKPEAKERSRAGKTANYEVYANEGFAFSCTHRDHEVHFIDLFPAMPAQEYLDLIYLPPGPFIR